MEEDAAAKAGEDMPREDWTICNESWTKRIQSYRPPPHTAKADDAAPRFFDGSPPSALLPTTP